VGAGDVVRFARMISYHLEAKTFRVRRAQFVSARETEEIVRLYHNELDGYTRSVVADSDRTNRCARGRGAQRQGHERRQGRPRRRLGARDLLGHRLRRANLEFAARVIPVFSPPKSFPGYLLSPLLVERMMHPEA
jgi:hypothetical protein